MGIRIQPLDIEVPEDNPFKHDRLNRQEAVHTLTHLVGKLDGPCAMAVDAPWGAGKTTFLRIWARHLRNEGFPVVEFNAWGTDFSEDPFVTLSSELADGLRDCGGEPLGGKIETFRKAATEVLRRTIPGLIRVGTAGILDISPMLEAEAGNALASYAGDRLTAYEETRNSVGRFTAVLQDAANTLSGECDGRPLILMIDELDRCRPSYAVELLEVAKHLFSVDGIVFVLAVNRDQLAHSVRALYGSDFDAEGYLRRFFDIDFRLPEPDRDAFINALLEATQIDQYFDQGRAIPFPEGHGVDRGLLLNIFAASDLSLRTVAQAIHRLGLALASGRSSPRLFALAMTVALILRTIDPDLYHRFTRGEVTDLDVVKSVFDRSGLATLRDGEWGVMFGAVLVLAAHEGKTSEVSNFKEIESPLLDSQPRIGGDSLDTDPRLPKARFREYAGRVSEIVDQAIRNEQGRIEFESAVQRLELLTHTLIDMPP